MRRLLYLPSIRNRGLQVLVGFAFPLAATLVVRILPGITTAAAAIFYLLVVVMAALVGRFWGGLLASAMSFLGLNFFFTSPTGTFRVGKVEDVVALVAFLLIAALIATLLTEVLEQRTRAERRERETSLLYELSSGLLSREHMDGVLDQVEKDLTDLFDLSGCELELLNPKMKLGSPQSRAMTGGPAEAQSFIEIPLRTERARYGVLRLYDKQDRTLTDSDKDVARAFATQVALAAEAASLDEQTRKAHGEAEASKIRAALFSSVTHDLKTPLSSVMAAATSLLEEGVEFDNERRTILLRTIVEETSRLNRLISNLLQLSRLRAGMLMPHKISTPIDDVIEAVVARLGGMFADRSLSLKIKVREDMRPVPMDVLQIDQVLSNILENAARYAPSGSDIEIRARQWQSWVEVLVSDQGPGIAHHNRELVFKEFYRGDGGESMGTSGLGLAIVRAIVTAHGGDAWIADTPGGGATVGFRLPLARPNC